MQELPLVQANLVQTHTRMHNLFHSISAPGRHKALKAIVQRRDGFLGLRASAAA